MLKLNAGFSRKVGEANYSSRGASVNVELELESGLVNDADALLERVRRLFTLAKMAVDEQLTQQTRPTNGTPVQNGHGNGQPRTTRPATSSQLRAIRAIASQLGLDPEQAARDTCGQPLDRLSIRDASQLIDDLKARQNTGASR